MIINGIYNRTIFRDEKNFFTKFSFITTFLDEYKNRMGDLICSGIILPYAHGMPLQLTGEIVEKNGFFEFKVTNAVEYSERNDFTVSFLSGKEFFGIGEKTAKKIVEYTGADIFSFILKPNAKELLLENVKGVTEKQVDSLIQNARSAIVQKNIYQFINQFGGDFSQAINLFNLFKINYKEKLLENCYTYGELAGLDFYICDSIAKYFNYSYIDERRIAALFKFSLFCLTNCGHIYSTITDISYISEYIIKNSAFAEPIPECLLIRAAVNSKNICIEDDNNPRYYFRFAWKAENKIVQNIKRIQNNSHPLCISENIGKECENICGIKYSEKQLDAFRFLFTTGIKILTGGPGTGKSTVINGLIRAYKSAYPCNKIALCAPTGRAAQRMSELTGMSASTIHRLLDIEVCNNSVEIKEKVEPLNADFVIVDEASMLDAEIFSLLLASLKDDTTLILCGDVDQLPSVGAGNILRDLIECNRFEVDRLDVVYRQSDDSDIVTNATNVNNGNCNFKESDTFKIINVNSDAEIMPCVKELIEKKYDKNNPFKVQVLSSTKRGKAGTRAMNPVLQEICNSTKAELAYDTPFKINDKIITTVNNYDVGYINGDLGTIKTISSNSMVVVINNEDITIPKENFKDVSLAYAMTTHKAQGSEYATVIIALPENPANMLKRNLLYTAITRAKKDVFIIGKKESIEKAVASTDNSRRNTMLKEKLNGYIPKLLFIKKGG